MRCPAIAQALRRAPRITFAPSKHFADGSGHLDVVVPGIGLEHLVVRNTGGGAIEVTFMVVTKQRAGAGTAAVRSLVAWAKGNGFTRMHLKANDSATGWSG